MLGPLCAVTLSFKRKTHLFQEQKLCTRKRTRWEPWFLNGAEIEPTAQRFIQRSVFHLWLVTLQLNVTLSRRIPMSHRFVGLNLQRYPALFLGYAIDVHSILYHSIRTPNTETGQVRSPTRSVVLRCVQLRNTCNLLQQWKWFPKQLKRPKKERAYCSLRTGWSMTSLVAEAWWRTACCALSLSRPRTVAFNIGNYIITWSDDSQTAILILPIRFNAERFIHFISSAWDVQRAKKLGIYLHLTQTVIFFKWSLAGSLCVGKACKSSNCTVQIMGLWDCNDWSCCQTTLHHFPTCGGCRCPEQFQWKVHEVWIWKLTVPRAPRYMRDWQSLCLSSSVIIGYHWYQLQHQFTLRIQDDPDSYVLKCFE